jgi:uncharacterized Zn finger protein (UPF0148 family)
MTAHGGIYCPKCGSLLTERDGELLCEAGGMYLSLRLRSILTGMVDNGPVDVPPASFGWGGSPYFCPADGTRMAESEGRMRCPACGRCMPSTIPYQLTEFHPHAAVRRPEDAGADHGDSSA